MAGFSEIEERIGNDIGLVLRNVAIVETRQKALEAFLFSGRFQLLKIALLAILSPTKTRQALGRVHGRMLKGYEDKLKAALNAKNERSIIKPLVSVTVLFLALVTGCVPRAKYDRAIGDLGSVTEEVNRQTRRADYCEEQQLRLVEVLRKFNQVDEKGKLRKGAK
jgi:hypothetical protein